MNTAHVFLFSFYFINASSQRFYGCKVWNNTYFKCKECDPGYLGQNCSEICRYPTYGEECQKTCECNEKYCDIAAGCFSPDVGCRAGYFGSRCVNKCRFPTFGKVCQKTCHCSKSFCNFITGCNVSKDAKQNEFPLPLQHNAERNLTIVVVILSVFSSILVSVFIVQVICRIKGPYLSNWKVFRNASPIRNQHTPHKATFHQHVSFDMSQRTDDTYCSSYNASQFQDFNHTVGVSTDDVSPQFHSKVLQREGSANTILFDISSSCGSDSYTLQKEKK